ncbi:hypothetical protein ZHAS_00010277 [Anopheles sinensis]|uniref:Uncharacterized protein n=1 Tax=Anopheles sinensis TaxID=74873 RepID=A0A084VX70_ANOSI|nr:hypothetical protein ZHAS_00010277 [Anopheles sinensis]
MNCRNVDACWGQPLATCARTRTGTGGQWERASEQESRPRAGVQFQTPRTYGTEMERGQPEPRPGVPKSNERNTGGAGGKATTTPPPLPLVEPTVRADFCQQSART